MRALEAGDVTRETIMAIAGISERTLRRRLARAREVRGEFEVFDAGEGDEYDFPHLIVTDDPDRERRERRERRDDREWYHPESGECSIETGKVRVGDYNGRRLLVRKVNGGRQGDDSGPTRYDPDPELKGGVG